MKTGDLRSIDLTTVQATTLLKTILTEEELVIESLYMSRNNLNEVDDQLLARALVKLKTVGLQYTGLTTVQASTLLQTILTEKELVTESVDLMGNNMNSVDSQLLARARAVGYIRNPFGPQ